jgi:hypothetical protein
LDCVLEEQPWDKSAEQKKRVVLLWLDLNFKAKLENERPTGEQNQRVNQSPKPAAGRAYEPLLEIPTDQLHQ